jgi:hypothetical protein
VLKHTVIDVLEESDPNALLRRSQIGKVAGVRGACHTTESARTVYSSSPPVAHQSYVKDWGDGMFARQAMPTRDSTETTALSAIRATISGGPCSEVADG